MIGGYYMKELYIVRSPYTFNGMDVRVEKPLFIVVGIPLDSTSSFRSGCRFAPLYVRLASQTIELFSLRSLINIEEIPIADVGDVVIPHGDVTRSLSIIEGVVSELISDGLRVVFIGGEHTISLGVVKGLIKALTTSNVCYLCFDSHSDFRYEYLGSKYSHACVTRRIYEILGNRRITLVGIRAISHEEYRDLKNSNIRYFTSNQVKTLGVREISRNISKALEDCSKIHLSIDLDVLDPAYAPGVTTPEPEGITPTELLDILQLIIDDRFTSLDVVELTPSYDQSMITSIVAAKIINEVIGMIYSKISMK
ncbi:MAG: agmatinase [Sulfolobales archaeon]